MANQFIQRKWPTAGKTHAERLYQCFNLLYREAVLDVYLFLTFDSSCRRCGQATDKRMDHEYNHRRLHEDKKTY